MTGDGDQSETVYNNPDSYQLAWRNRLAYELAEYMAAGQIRLFEAGAHTGHGLLLGFHSSPQLSLPGAH